MADEHQRLHRRPARLEDVAREAEVHVSTVSRVLTQTAGVTIRDETRARVLEAARRLHYRPNAMARGLRRAQTGALGLIVPSLGNPVYADMIRGAYERAWERDFVVLLVEDETRGSAAVAYERLAEEGRIDGLLISTGAVDRSLLGQFEKLRVPYVFLNRRVTGSRCSAVMREEEAGRLAAEHLASLGHFDIAHLSGPRSLDTARRRTRGFTEALHRFGISPAVAHAAYTERTAYQAVMKLLGGDHPTALFISNFNQAIGALAGLRELGLRVPHDVSIVSCDDHPIIEFLEVPLTTVQMPLRRLGALGVDLLLEQISGSAPRDGVVSDEPQLVLRASSRRHGR